MQRHMYAHSRILNDGNVSLADKTDPKNLTKLGDYSIHTLKTKTSLELNAEDSHSAKRIVFYFTSLVPYF